MFHRTGVIVLAVFCMATFAQVDVTFSSDSAVTTNNGSFAAPVIQAVTITPSLILQLVNSDGSVNTSRSNTSVGVLVSCDTVSLSGTTFKYFINGVATFNDLIPTQCPGTLSPLKFVVNDIESPASAIDGKTLLTGVMSVIAIPNYYMRYTKESFITSSKDSLKDVVIDVDIQAIVIQLLDSCNNDDTSCYAVSITASASAGTLAGELTATISGGVAVFSKLRFTGKAPAGPVNLYFTVDPTSSIPLAGQNISSGPLNVQTQPTKHNEIRFATSGSLITGEGQGVDTVLNTPLAPIVVQMYDSAGAIDNSPSVGMTVNITGASSLQGGQVSLVNGVANFSNLIMTTCPNKVAPKFTFTVYGDNVAKPVIMTGAVKVAGKPKYGLALDKAANASDPAAIINVVDSCGNPDTNNNGGISVTATPSGTNAKALLGKLTATTDINGVAKFNDLRFDPQATYSNVYIEFSAQGLMSYSLGPFSGAPPATNAPTPVTPGPTSNSTNTKSNDGGLAGGAVAGIVIGILVFVVFVALIVRRRLTSGGIGATDKEMFMVNNPDSYRSVV
eukprot:PhF_6_TR3754/c0_g1_i1/m.5423